VRPRPRLSNHPLQPLARPPPSLWKLLHPAWPGGFRPAPARRALVVTGRRTGSTGGGAGSSGPGERVELPDRSGKSPPTRGARSRPRARAPGWLVDPSASIHARGGRTSSSVEPGSLLLRCAPNLATRSSEITAPSRSRLFRHACSALVAAGWQPIFIFLC